MPARAGKQPRGPQHLELLSYQPTSHHGHAVVRFLPGEKLNADDPEPYTFHNHAYRFYNLPPGQDADPLVRVRAHPIGVLPSQPVLVCNGADILKRAQTQEKRKLMAGAPVKEAVSV